jgi:hypothetical protein
VIERLELRHHFFLQLIRKTGADLADKLQLLAFIETPR